MCAVVDHGCEHICSNLPDSCECRCCPVYRLNISLKTCNSNNTCLTSPGTSHPSPSLVTIFYCILHLNIFVFMAITFTKPNKNVTLLHTHVDFSYFF